MAGSFLKKTGLTVAATLVVAMCMPNALNAQQEMSEEALAIEFLYLERLEAAEQIYSMNHYKSCVAPLEDFP